MPHKLIDIRKHKPVTNLYNTFQAVYKYINYVHHANDLCCRWWMTGSG